MAGVLAADLVSAIDVAFLTDGGQPASATRDRLFAFLSGAQHSLDLAIYDAHFNDDTGDRLIELLDDAETRGVQVRGGLQRRAPATGPDPPASGGSVVAPAPGEGRAVHRHPRHPRPHASQVRRARRRHRVDRIDQLDERRVDADGEPHRHRRVVRPGRRLHAGLRAAVDQAASRAHRHVRRSAGRRCRAAPPSGRCSRRDAVAR